MNRERLAVCNRGKLRDLVHGMEHDGKLSHGKSSCNGLYNRLEIQYNHTEKEEMLGLDSLLSSIIENGILYYPQKIQTFFAHNL